LFDLLTRQEEREEASTGHLRFDIQLLARRLLAATDWCHSNHPELSIGYFGSSTGGGAALVAAAVSPVPIAAVVSRGGRPDLAGDFLERVKAPTLLLVGSKDTEVVEMNRRAAQAMSCTRELRLVEGATHLFQEPGALESVARAAAVWFEQHLRGAASAGS
jgi:putative phosphoribosyl transferase